MSAESRNEAAANGLLRPDSLVPGAVLKEAIRAEAACDALRLAFSVHLDPGALRRRLDDIEAGVAGALDGVPDRPVAGAHSGAYHRAILSAGRQVADMVEQATPRSKRGKDRVRPSSRLQNASLLAQGRRRAFRYVASVGGWPSSIRRRIAIEERHIQRWLQTQPDGLMKPGAGPRIVKDAFIAGLREALGLLEQHAPGPHPLDMGRRAAAMDLSREQRRHLAVIRESSKNWFDGDVVADDLLGHAELWEAAAIGGYTVYLFPHAGREHLLEALANGWYADDCGWVALDAGLREWVCDAFDEPGVGELLRGRRQALRLWWD